MDKSKLLDQCGALGEDRTLLARGLFVQVYPDTRGHLKAASKPCTHAFPSYVRFLAFSHLWHNITMTKLVKSILHSHL